MKHNKDTQTKKDTIDKKANSFSKQAATSMRPVGRKDDAEDVRTDRTVPKSTASAGSSSEVYKRDNLKSEVNGSKAAGGRVDQEGQRQSSNKNADLGYNDLDTEEDHSSQNIDTFQSPDESVKNKRNHKH